jgi:BASS family bile acid:Na+ symporter
VTSGAPPPFDGLLSGLLDLAVLVFAVSSMLSVGAGHRLRELVAPLRSGRGVARVLLANFVLVPLLAVAVARLLSLPRPLEDGLVLLGMAAGAPFLVKLTEHAEHDVGKSATLLLLLLPATVAYMPLAVPAAVPGATVSARAIAVPLVVTMLVPLAAGLATRAGLPGAAARLRPHLSRISSVALVVLVAATVLRNLPEILDVLGKGAIPAAALVSAGAFAAGWALGGKDPENRAVLGLGTAQRNIVAAAVVARQSFDDPETLVMVVVSSLVALAILFAVASRLRRVTPRDGGTRARPAEHARATPR